jgi:hypothetical protein
MGEGRGESIAESGQAGSRKWGAGTKVCRQTLQIHETCHPDPALAGEGSKVMAVDGYAAGSFARLRMRVSEFHDVQS